MGSVQPRSHGLPPFPLLSSRRGEGKGEGKERGPGNEVGLSPVSETGFRHHLALVPPNDSSDVLVVKLTRF